MDIPCLDKELAILHDITRSFTRHPRQCNRPFESDAEVIDVRKMSCGYLVLKTDGIHEEIKEKLYGHPALIGWMAATASISDLAATGATPFGILLTLQIPRKTDECWLAQFQAGINEACEQYHVSVLGGDTNFDPSISVATTCIGFIESGEPVSRKGLKAGDLLYATGRLGLGNAYAYGHYFDPRLQISYKPVARLRESITIRKFATSCIDTSDGLFPALSVLSQINGMGFTLGADLLSVLHPDARHVSAISNIPPWMLLAGPHGEYELLFTVPPDRKDEFEKEYRTQNGHPVLLGTVIMKQQLNFTSRSIEVTCGPSAIANLFHEAEGDVRAYYRLLKQQHTKWLIS